MLACHSFSSFVLPCARPWRRSFIIIIVLNHLAGSVGCVSQRARTARRRCITSICPRAVASTAELINHSTRFSKAISAAWTAWAQTTPLVKPAASVRPFERRVSRVKPRSLLSSLLKASQCSDSVCQFIFPILQRLTVPPQYRPQDIYERYDPMRPVLAHL